MLFRSSRWATSFLVNLGGGPCASGGGGGIQSTALPGGAAVAGFAVGGKTAADSI